MEMGERGILHDHSLGAIPQGIGLGSLEWIVGILSCVCVCPLRQMIGSSGVVLL